MPGALPLAINISMSVKAEHVSIPSQRKLLPSAIVGSSFPRIKKEPYHQQKSVQSVSTSPTQLHTCPSILPPVASAPLFLVQFGNILLGKLGADIILNPAVFTFVH